jgi:hypothetical protein
MNMNMDVAMAMAMAMVMDMKTKNYQRSPQQLSTAFFSIIVGYTGIYFGIPCKIFHGMQRNSAHGFPRK